MRPAACFAPSLPLQCARGAAARLHPHVARRLPPSRPVPRRVGYRAQAPSPPAAAAAATTPPRAVASEQSIYRCPRCTTVLPAVPPNQLSSLPTSCGTCGNAFPRTAAFVDLTVSRRNALPRPLRLLRDLAASPREQALFQLPLVSYAYERGWRDSFASAGFPGIDRELDLLLDFAPSGQRILDLSCGTGLMARRLAVSRTYGRVVAADYSQAMLREAAARARADAAAPEFELVRADVGALPFESDVFDTVHSGAALHCWPSVLDALREVQRVLKPGGRLFATTFANGLDGVTALDDGASAAARVRAAVRVRRMQVMGAALYRFFERKELFYLAQAAGFTEVDVTLDKLFLVLRCRKPLK